MKSFKLEDFIFNTIKYLTHKNIDGEKYFFNYHSIFETELNYNILHLVDLSTKLENFFDICIYRYELNDVVTVGDLVKLIYEKLKNS